MARMARHAPVRRSGPERQALRFRQAGSALYSENECDILELRKALPTAAEPEGLAPSRASWGWLCSAGAFRRFS
jgi:hypothetical protein